MSLCFIIHPATARVRTRHHAQDYKKYRLYAFVQAKPAPETCTKVGSLREVCWEESSYKLVNPVACSN